MELHPAKESRHLVAAKLGAKSGWRSEHFLHCVKYVVRTCESEAGSRVREARNEELMILTRPLGLKGRRLLDEKEANSESHKGERVEVTFGCRACVGVVLGSSQPLAASASALATLQRAFGRALRVPERRSVISLDG